MRSAQSSNQVEDLARQADELARKQQDLEGQMRRAYTTGDGPSREQLGQIVGQRDDEISQLKKLEQGMQSAVRDLQSTQRQAATKMREALGDMQQSELARGMQRNADWIRRGMGQYAVMSESQITAGLNDLRDQLKQVQQAMVPGGKDGKGGQDDKAMERALAQVEQMRRQMEQLASQGQRGQQGRQGQQGGQGQQGQLSRNGQQQGGQQQGGQQQGGQQQGGQQQAASNRRSAAGRPAGRQQGSPGNSGGGQTNPNNGGYGGQWNGGNYGGPWTDGPVRPQDFQNTYRDTMQTLMQLQQQLRDDPNTQRDVQGLIRDLRNWDPFTKSNDPMLNERIQAALAGIEQVEMELRRKVDDTTAGGNVRSPGGEVIPPGYQDKVAEYYRKLSKGK